MNAIRCRWDGTRYRFIVEAIAEQPDGTAAMHLISKHETADDAAAAAQKLRQERDNTNTELDRALDGAVRATNAQLAQRVQELEAKLASANERRIAWEMNAQQSAHAWAQAQQRIAALEAQIEAAHRAIDSIGLSRCADAHAGVYPDGRITCDDGRPPLSLYERTKWLITWMTDEPYPMGKRVTELESALKAAQDDAARLRAVIEQVEWGAENTMYWSDCMWCKKPYPTHAPDCLRQAALAQTGGEVKA